MSLPTLIIIAWLVCSLLLSLFFISFLRKEWALQPRSVFWAYLIISVAFVVLGPFGVLLLLALLRFYPLDLEPNANGQEQ